MNIFKKGKGVYYLNKKCPKADKELFEFLLKGATNENLNISRCCLHKDEKSSLMSIIFH